MTELEREKALAEIIDIIKHSWLSEAGRYRQIEAVVKVMIREER